MSYSLSLARRSSVQMFETAMKKCLLAIALGLLSHGWVRGAELPPAAEKQIDFERDIAPILEASCHDCHGEFSQESEFRLDRKSAVLRGGNSGEPGIVVGSSATSHLIQLVAGLEPKLRMPPDEADALSADQIGLLRAWIDQGAVWPGPHGMVDEEKRTTDHWAFQPVQPVAVPQTPGDWAKNPIDHFILAKLQDAGLSPNPAADRSTLYRRLSLDLHGLPPKPAAVQAFAETADTQTTDQVIEEMLASPHFGERWATHWLDLVRFAETYGFETNRERPTAWRYRDYVIRSFNEDKPYDQFVREQLAGDSCGEPMGLGYLVAGPYDEVKSPDINLTLMQRQNELDDIINTTSTAFLGITVGCARCHNHKFDPILQSDYYSMQAIFAGVQHGEMALPLTAEQQERADVLRDKITQLESELSPFIVRHDARRFLLMDDEPTQAESEVTQLVKPTGIGTNPAGDSRGQASDPGAAARTPNVSGGKYTWWSRKPNEPVIAWAPSAVGQYRVWLSWGCGIETHCQDAKYVIDRDGDLQTRDDWETLAIVNQQHFADGGVSQKREPLWSGFYPTAVTTIDANDQILLVGGETGAAITADVVLLEKVSGVDNQAPGVPLFREAVDSTGNVEHFSPQQAKFIRFVIEATNTGQPCVDEFEIFSNGENIALAKRGAKATASGSLAGYPVHKLEHINDGLYSNNHSWISDSSESSWVQIELAEVSEIDRIEWARDREGAYADRLATQYRFEVSTNGSDWETVAESSDRLQPRSPQKSKKVIYQFDHLTPAEAATGKSRLQELEAARAEYESATQPQQAYAGQYRQPGPTYRLYRGEPLGKREQVPPNAPEIFTDLELALDAPEAERRKQLAEWIASAENPLTARVIVNRIWQFHFGAALVDTPSDFGQAGIAPTHPELLDWLASELVQHDWSLKHIHRLILQSATYQQSSQPNAAGLQRDGASQLLWRYPPHRLDAEPIRDSILEVSGTLDRQMGGAGFSAFRVEPENVRHYHPKQSFGPSDWRRMVYMTKVRMEKDAVFGLFDCPDAATSVAKRSRSTTPLQALNLFNSTFLLQQAEIFGQRLQAAADTPEGQIQQAFELCYAREPGAEELSASREFIEQQGLTAFCRALLNSNEFLFIQ